MFSTNLKRSAATLGVAGLLAAAAPASAMPAGVNTGQENDALTAARSHPAPTVGS